MARRRPGLALLFSALMLVWGLGAVLGTVGAEAALPPLPLAKDPDPLPTFSMVSITPVDGSTGIGLRPNIILTFDEPVSRGSFEARHWITTLSGIRVTHTTAYADDDRMVTLRPSSELEAGLTYSVGLDSNLLARSGTALGQFLQSRFTTDDSLAPPRVDFTDPGFGVNINVQVHPVVRFTKAMDTGATVRAFTLTTGGAQVPGEITWSSDATTFRFKPLTLLTADTVYLYRVDTGATSWDGIHLRFDLVREFRTTPDPDLPAPGGGGGEGNSVEFVPPEEPPTESALESVKPITIPLSWPPPEPLLPTPIPGVYYHIDPKVAEMAKPIPLRFVLYGMAADRVEVGYRPLGEATNRTLPLGQYGETTFLYGRQSISPTGRTGGSVDSLRALLVTEYFTRSRQEWRLDLPAQDTEGYLMLGITAYNATANLTFPVEPYFPYPLKVIDPIPPTLTHEPPTTVDLGFETTLKVRVKDNLEVRGAYIEYRSVQDPSFTRIDMIRVTAGIRDVNFSVDLPVTEQMGMLLYRVVAYDGNLTGVLPGDQPYYVIRITDPTPPTIDHVPPSDPELYHNLPIVARVQDEVRVRSVEVVYRMPDGGEGRLALTRTTPNAQDAIYQDSLPPPVSPGALAYRIEAWDGAGHLAAWPALDAWHILDLTDTTPPHVSYRVPTELPGDTDSRIWVVAADDQLVRTVVVEWQLDDGDLQRRALRLDDGTPGYGRWSVTLPAAGGAGWMTLRFIASDGTSTYTSADFTIRVVMPSSGPDAGPAASPSGGITWTDLSVLAVMLALALGAIIYEVLVRRKGRESGS